MFLPDKKSADEAGQEAEHPTVSHSGWHVYNNMEQILGKKMITDQGCPYNCTCYPGPAGSTRRGCCPQTDRLLERAINISVGVVDRGLGSAFGIHPHSTDAEIDQKAQQFRQVVKEVLG